MTPLRSLFLSHNFLTKKSQGVVRQLLDVKISPNVSLKPLKGVIWHLSDVKMTSSGCQIAI